VPNADELREQLREHGDRRRDALDAAAVTLEEVLQLAPAAMEAGITVPEIGRLSQVGRRTLYDRLQIEQD
jgi:hypothetical protein